MSAKWKVGDNLVHPAMGLGLFGPSCVGLQDMLEGAGWRLAVEPAAPPTTATERKLAPGECGRNIGGMGEGDACNMPVGHDGGCNWSWLRGPMRKVSAQPVPDAAMRDLLRGNRAADQLPRSPVSRSELERAVATIAWLPNKQCSGENRRSSSWVDHCQLDEGHGGDHAWPSTGSKEMIAKQQREAIAYRAPKPVAPPRCGTCTHVHAGPCDGTSPNGEFACPCGYPKVVAKREAVGEYPEHRVGSAVRTFHMEQMTAMDMHIGATATLTANLAREKPPGRRPIRTVARYEGNSDD